MTDEMAMLIKREFDEAIESGDSRRIDKAVVSYSIAMMDCQKKTATRVKESQQALADISAKFAKLEGTVENSIARTDKHAKEIGEIKSDIAEFKKLREQARGASWVLKAVYGASAGGGIALIVKLMEMFLK